MEKIQLNFLNPQSPFTLFLILVLLVLGTEKELESYLENAKNFVLETRRSMESIRGGVQNMHANMTAFQTHLLQLNEKK
ncbi:hypothetical protein Desru_3034 [Desulforamulus ruminis DSM 2154]|uniref:Uncharacterized protein n=1 Tax=Desulforamulus ruminis (strain ATCC 23193 / DSM 2154 / NCIMB 8452 / DL) TaxID=696281 RepID=F6DTS1_DESRL|nr:hypothetical protein [Desulforamulus ruminis]AEG61245.1 hypothetical protein Desru_3034 [Desulforamulus ruminis DSM 2154]